MSMLLPRYQGMQCYLVRLPEFHFLCCQPVKAIWARKKALNFKPTTLLRKVILICFHKLPRLMYLQSKSFDCFFFFTLLSCFPNQICSIYFVGSSEHLEGNPMWLLSYGKPMITNSYWKFGKITTSWTSVWTFSGSINMGKSTLMVYWLIFALPTH